MDYLILRKIFIINFAFNSLSFKFPNITLSTVINNLFFDPDTVKEDANLLTHELIKKYKYPVEIHHATTEDGYILELHRIVKENTESFLLIHDLADSSATFVLMGPKHGLGYFLWDRGYDVWLGNCRGNRYSKQHKILDAENAKFWNFSWHEIGVYDIPAMIDYILQKTGQKKLHYVGHSQGATVFYVMCAKRTEYNEKIFLMHALAPLVFMKNIKCPFCFLMEIFLRSKSSQKLKEFLPRQSVTDSIWYSNPITKIVSMQIYQLIMGHNPDEYNQTMYPVIHSHMPAGSSIKQFRHYFQLIHSGKFHEFDYGIKSNLIMYQSEMPPEYNLTKIITPTLLYFSKNDYLNDPKDVHQLYKVLPNVQGLYQIYEKKFSHMDFCWGINARYLVYERILEATNDFKIGKLKYIVE